MKKYGFIGAGKMAGAMVRGMLAGGVSASEISCVSGDDGTDSALADSTGISIAGGLADICASSRLLVLACKPQQIGALADSEAAEFKGLLVSILAGTAISRLRGKFANASRIVRAMPNMPAQISEGITCYASEGLLSDSERGEVLEVLNPIGSVLAVDEGRLDAVTAVSGSGPGYFFEFAAAMQAAAVSLGFSEEEARGLVVKTLLGSAKLLSQSELSADELRRAVSSPGGTTLAALDVFEKSGFRKTVLEALAAAEKRSKELSKL